MDNVNYDIFKHKTGVRVVELSTGRRGIVKEIRETAAEWIDPFVLWDDSNELSIPRFKLLLEHSLTS